MFAFGRPCGLFLHRRAQTKQLRAAQRECKEPCPCWGQSTAVRVAFLVAAMLTGRAVTPDSLKEVVATALDFENYP